MTQPTKPSAGALRAAKMIEGNFSTAPEPEDVLMSAQIIDRETGVAELLDAAKAAEVKLYQAADLLDAHAVELEDRWSKDMATQAAAAAVRIRQAVAKCQGKGSE